MAQTYVAFLPVYVLVKIMAHEQNAGGKKIMFKRTAVLQTRAAVHPLHIIQNHTDDILVLQNTAYL